VNSVAMSPASLRNLAGSSGPVLRPASNLMLRPLRVEDITDRYIEGINRPEISRFLISAANGRLTGDQIRAFVRSDWESSNAILFGVFISDVHCGNVRIYDVTAQRAYIGAAIFDTAARGHGYGSASISAVAAYAISGLGIERIIAAIDHSNIVSQKAFSGAGFRCVEADPAAEGSIWHYP
jgi:RimJ/RimL family protein N-acetyltransferase